MLGWFAQRVLGQYDLLVPDDPAASGDADADAVYYVGANILGLEKRFAFRPRDFRLWIAIHECTHRAQFTAVPWLKPYFLSLVDQALGIVDPDPKRIVQSLVRAADELRQGRNPLDDGGLVALLASPEQRGVIAQVQSLMSVLEGHGNRVMNELGRTHVAGQERMARVLDSRRQSRGHAEPAPQAARARRQDAPVRGRRGVRRRRRARGRPARARPGLARARSGCPTVDELSEPAGVARRRVDACV